MKARYLLDTNVLSETRKRTPAPQVLAFLGGLTDDAVYTSALVIAELRKGAARRKLLHASEGDALGQWIDGLEARMKGRLLPVDVQVAAIWGDLQAERERPVMDTLIAATAIAHGLVLVTRNVRDMDGLAVPLLNPWDAAA